MSVVPRTAHHACMCCKAPYRDTGCTRGYSCRCNGHYENIDGVVRYIRPEWCRVPVAGVIWCNKCPEHCPHTPEERQAAKEADEARREVTHKHD